MIKKVTAAMLNALASNREWRLKATSTHRGERGMLVRLHENLIAVILPDSVEFCAQGHATATTVERMNAIAQAYCNATIGRRKGRIVATIDGQPAGDFAATDRFTLPRI